MLPASSSPTRLQLFFPKSTPSTAIRIVHPSKSARSQPTASGFNKGRAIHKRGTHRRALGRSRGGFTSKLHCLADALGRPLAFHLTVGEAADCKAYDALIGLSERAPDALLADKGYDADTIRADLAKRNIEAVIPGRSNRRVKIEHDRALYKQRNRIERMFGQLKINRAIATRYDQLANSFLGMVHLATARYWLKFVHAA
ncbi:IS5 family transposase [Sphingobium ummariense]|uniref:IS5 family transposase n=1 Tax=Sphingobium ummariense TaxID=420994 RepID=UPI001F02C95B|nr:IS5 family transposase [Sphingobium ummariense]